MTKQGVVVPVPEAVVAVPTNSVPLFQYPPPREVAPGIAVCKKHLQMGAAVGGSVGGHIGGWVECMRASSPTHAKLAATLAAGVDEERYAALVVRACASVRPQTSLAPIIPSTDGGDTRAQMVVGKPRVVLRSEIDRLEQAVCGR